MGLEPLSSPRKGDMIAATLREVKYCQWDLNPRITEVESLRHLTRLCYGSYSFILELNRFDNYNVVNSNEGAYAPSSVLSESEE